MISFNTIPINLLTPGQYIEFDSSKAARGVAVIPHRILVIAPRLATASIPALQPTRVNSAAQGESFFGRGSIGAAMLAAVKAANPYTDCFAVGVSDAGGGVAATGTLTVSGPATAAGSLVLYIAGTRVAISVASGDSANTIAAALNTAINANTALPVTSTVASAVVTLTARNKGTTGNDIDVRLNYNEGDTTPAGVAVAIVAMANGATNPDLATVTAALGDSQYHTIVTPYTDSANLTVLETFLLGRWDGTVMKDGVAFGAVTGTHSQIATVATARNSPFMCLLGVQKSPTPPWIFASVLAAIDASQAESPTNCNRPRQTLALTSCLPPAESDRYTRTERNTHLASGAATFLVDEGGVCRIERVVTTYKTVNGVPDAAYRDVERIRALQYIRYSTRARVASKYPRHKLASDGYEIPPGAPIVTPKVVRDELITLGQDWLAVGLIEDFETFKRELLVMRNESDADRVDAILPPNIIDGFRVFAGQVQFR